ncbi:cobalamin-independent methionine synthase II family protein [Rhodococcus pyridinivorans]|uniref:5-methyltetrahydropteroyltriglutamate-homocysteine methyltransferase n=1 Tax=Rhodococcus pyridinivorans AK37 TaxID=1114960 RepID=H0JTJ4_9NOCA|nr:cobalamin-independent methionine synthase II family protein [Rhodococcus pyridinivorans]EHK82535.1 5-methyltetrahydropteroyltriglutamate-homocysteine methyltransferase [Rhodococcus pyridinivorans AK37]MCD2141637.1 cobalamin-independent methionine synthase II family protein [Rhodococcus pyridinivorans]
MSTPRIRTTHAGSLPRTTALVEANRARREAADGFRLDTSEEFAQLLGNEVTALVRRQVDLGICTPGDGEYGKAMSSTVDYGAWWSYSFQRLSGLQLTDGGPFGSTPIRSTPGNVRLTTFPDRRDWTLFAEAYGDPDSGVSIGKEAPLFPTATGPVTYIGHDAIASDIANLKSALAAARVENGFMTSLSPGSASRIGNEHYATEEEFIWACADAMREEYKAIIDAGLILQIDDPSIAENWDQINPEPTVEDYLAFTRIRVEALNYALRGLPQDRIRFHLCWGSWHGPHTTDLEFEYLVETMLDIDAGSYSFEAANVRHEHEWRVWEDVKLPDGKQIVPGVISHATNVVGHPELVADRIERFANLARPGVGPGTAQPGVLHPSTPDEAPCPNGIPPKNPRRRIRRARGAGRRRRRDLPAFELPHLPAVRGTRP